MVIQCKQNIILGTFGELKLGCVLPKPLACSHKSSSWSLRSEERLCVQKAHLPLASLSAPSSSYLLLKTSVKMFSSLSPLLYPFLCFPPFLPSFLYQPKLQGIPLLQSTVLAGSFLLDHSLWSIIVHGQKPNGIHWQHWLNFTIVWPVVLTYLRFSNLPSLFSYCHLCHLSLSFFYPLKVIYKSVNQYLCAMFSNIETSGNVIK